MERRCRRARMTHCAARLRAPRARHAAPGARSNRQMKTLKRSPARSAARVPVRVPLRPPVRSPVRSLVRVAVRRSVRFQAQRRLRVFAPPR
eukprot:4640687-Pleurochrysis_carterae.AAC.1